MALVSEGDVIAGRYRVGRPLGDGGFGVVYEAEHLVTGRECAIKILLPRGGDAELQRTRFARESRLPAKVAGPHVAEVLDAGIFDDMPYIVMERLHGEDLGELVAREGPRSPVETVLYLRHVAAGLSAAHQAGVVHRDLKPSNMFLATRGDRPWVKVLDFGTAKLLRPEGDGATTAAIGTPLYMAPEQFASTEVTTAVDIHALGMSAFRLLTGEHYFELERAESANPFALGAMLVHGTPESASARAARYGRALPTGFDGWFARCTAIDPDDRFPSAMAAVETLQRALAVTEEALDAVEAPAPASRDVPAERRTASLGAGASTTAVGSNLSVDRGGEPDRVGRRPLVPLAAAAIVIVAALAFAARPTAQRLRIAMGPAVAAAVVVLDVPAPTVLDAPDPQALPPPSAHASAPHRTPPSPPSSEPSTTPERRPVAPPSKGSLDDLWTRE